MSEYYLNQGLPKPVASPDGLDGPFWEAAQQGILKLQKCRGCNKFQWGPEWICHRCHSFDLGFEEVEATGTIYSYERVWHPVHPALKDQGAYLVVLVELPHADQVRMVGNLVGDAEQHVVIGSEVQAVFEHHPDDDPSHTLVNWALSQ
jgi:uncharacterized OB-fold protein|tara:strand:- start:8882 stop:9325 length:444 start_codon:yes stop_codon:yes gene_type:complete